MKTETNIGPAETSIPAIPIIRIMLATTSQQQQQQQPPLYQQQLSNNVPNPNPLAP